MTLKGKKQNKLTVKQELFVKKYTDSTNKETFLKTKNSFIASTGSDPKSSYGMNGGYMCIRKPKVRAAIIEALHRVKITPMFQAKRLKRLMEWSKPVWHEGIKVGEVEDGEIQHKALVTSLKITDALDNLERSLDEKGQGLSVHIAPELAERLVRIAAEMKMMREAHSQQAIPLIDLKSKEE